MPLACAQLGPWPTTQACVLDWESNQWPFGSQAGTQPLSHTCQGSFFFLSTYHQWATFWPPILFPRHLRRYTMMTVQVLDSSSWLIILCWSRPYIYQSLKVICVSPLWKVWSLLRVLFLCLSDWGLEPDDCSSSWWRHSWSPSGNAIPGLGVFLRLLSKHLGNRDFV